ncbi:hypothetical protein BUALT_Bualt19G0049500 [Buddleja alternifolia]|uniref:Protein LNK2 n=1 Tax=Buddleja alternifolia TaxID=168488 RepID=A0AAV6W9H7_9LAMI|nr:hypothetical protein BUALT_Bualt19G0049500 [Buddleja alternifolia]
MSLLPKLTNIIWGEAGECDDHIVPYPEQVEERPPLLFGDPTKKETNRETANVSPVERKKPIIKSEHGVKLNNNSKYDPGDPATGLALSSWPDETNPSLLDAAKADQDSMGNAASNNITKNSKQGSLRDETAQFGKDSELFQNPPENGEQVDYVDYGWANIGSFDDLDNIFSNNDPIFGDLSVGNTDELWTSSKDVSSSPLGPTPLNGDSSDLALGPLRTSSDRSEIKAQYMLDPSQSFVSGYEKSNEITSHAPQNLQASIDTIEHSGGKSKLLLKEKTFEMGRKIQACHKQLDDDGYAATLNEVPEKGNKQKRLLKGKTLGKKIEVTRLHDLGGTWSSSRSPFQQLNSQYSPSMVNPCTPLVLTRPEPMQQKQFSVPLLASPVYGNAVNYYPPPPPPPPVMAQSSGFPPGNANSLKEPPAMTPKEKIEKLRRRQQMRAILAIQKQQQQFGNQAEYPIMDGGKVEVDESLSSIPSLDPNSPIEHDESNTSSMAFDNCSVEESVLSRLQDTIAKLDIQIRLCIRDSLFRLAQSAMQRQYSSVTSSTNTRSIDEVLGNKDTDVAHERFTRTLDEETDTNPIDRTVAHLLFHRPPEFYGANLPYEKKAISAKVFFPDDFENTQMTSPQESKTPRVFSKGDKSKNSPRLDTFENASNNEAAYGGMKKAEASN